MTGDAHLANQAELAAADHDDPHLIEGDCICRCRACDIPGDPPVCICPVCACREDD